MKLRFNIFRIGLGAAMLVALVFAGLKMWLPGGDSLETEKTGSVSGQATSATTGSATTGPSGNEIGARSLNAPSAVEPPALVQPRSALTRPAPASSNTPPEMVDFLAKLDVGALATRVNGETRIFGYSLTEEEVHDALKRAVKSKEYKKKKAKDAAMKDSNWVPLIQTPLQAFEAHLKDPTQALRYADKHASEMSAEELKSAINMVSELDLNADSHNLLNSLMRRLGKVDIDAAWSFSEQISSRRVREGALRYAMGSWAETNPQEAYRWLEQNWHVKNVSSIMDVSRVFGGLAKEDYEGTLSKVWGLPDSYMKRQALGSVLGQIPQEFRQDELLRLYRSAPSQEDSAIIGRTLLEGWRLYEPDTAAEWISQVGNPEIRQDLTRSLVSSWGRDAPQETLAWISDINDEEFRRQQLGYVGRQWARDDPDMMSEWLLRQPPSGSRDPLVESMVKEVMKETPQNAVHWAESITDVSRREYMIRYASREWLKQDYNTAVAYINSSPYLSDKTRLALIPQ